MESGLSCGIPEESERKSNLTTIFRKNPTIARKKVNNSDFSTPVSEANRGQINWRV